MTSLQKTNSWHWLLISVLICLSAGTVLSRAAWKKSSEKNGPAMQSMKAHSDQLKLLVEEDALLLEHQTAELQKKIHSYHEAVRKQSGEPVPKGEQGAQELGNKITRELIAHQLRVVEQEQTGEGGISEGEGNQPVASDLPPEVRRANAVRAAVASAAKEERARESLPYSTREVRYVLEGEFRHMFMFLVRQSHLKPSYHFKGISILPSPRQEGMRMEFIVQIHHT